VLSFAAAFVVVRRKSDGKLGSLEFTHHPRVYFGFEAVPEPPCRWCAFEGHPTEACPKR
jgi:hypothetical protein